MTEGQGFRIHEEAYAGTGLTFCRLPAVVRPAQLTGTDVAIVGAPFDLGTSYRPGTRFGPRAIRSAEDVGSPSVRPHMELGINPFEHIAVVDYGDCVVGPTIQACHTGLHAAVSDILNAGAVPIILGGDHSLSLPVLEALSERHGAEGFGVIHFDTHADTAIYEPGTTTEHATPFYRAVEEGYLKGGNVIQVGLRGAWPHQVEFEWMRENDIAWFSMDTIDELGMAAVVQQVIDRARACALTYLTVDIDVLDPAFAPGTGTPEPGGLTSRELLRAVRAIAASLDLCAMDVVEVSPPYDPAGITALAAHRVVLEVISAMALRRCGRMARPQRPQHT